MIPKSIKMLLLLFAVLTGLAFPLNVVDAGLLLTIAGTLFYGIARMVGGGLKQVAIIGVKVGAAAWLSHVTLGFANAFLIWAANPNLVEVALQDNRLVQTGWQIVRDFVNLFFILILVAIGIGTALRIRGYEIQKILPRLILVAILINFTPVIVGVVVDASNVVMDFFFAAGGVGGFGELRNLSQAASESAVGGIGKLLGSAYRLGEVLFKAFFVMVFNFTIAFALLTLAFLFIVRHLAIWILVVLSPLAFFCFILPRTQKIWTMWWEQLFKWSFVGIGAMFFLYLAQIMSRESANIISLRPPAEDMALDAGAGNLLMQIFPAMFLLISLFVINSTSAMGASSVIGLTRKGAGWVKGKGKSMALNQLRSSVRQTKETAQREGKRALAPLTQRMDRWSKDVAQTDPDQVQGARQKALYWAKKHVSEKALETTSAVGSKEVEKLVEEFKKLTREQRTLKARSGTDNEKIAAILAKGEKQEGKDLTAQEINSAIQTAGKIDTGAAKKVMAMHPEEANNIWQQKENQILSLQSEESRALLAGNTEEKDKINKQIRRLQKEMKDQGLEVTQADKDAGYDTLEKKIMANMKPQNIANLSEDYITSESAQQIAHDFWKGSQLSAAGRELGRSFVDEFNKATENINQKITTITDPNDPNYVSDEKHNRYQRLNRYLRGNAGQELGFNTIARRPEPPEEEGETPTIHRPPERGHIRTTRRHPPNRENAEEE